MLFLVHVVCALTGRLICPLTFPKRTLEMVGTIPITSVGPSCRFPYNIKFPCCFWLWGVAGCILLFSRGHSFCQYTCVWKVHIHRLCLHFFTFLRSVIVPAVSVVLQMASVVDLIATVATIGPLGQVALVYVSPQTIQQGEALAISCVRKKIMEFIISISYKCGYFHPGILIISRAPKK